MNKRLEEVRKNHALTKKEFALKLNITEQAYQNYSNGKRIIPTDVVLKVKCLFNISIDWLLSGEEVKSNINYKKELIKSIENLKNDQIEYIYYIVKAEEIKNKE